MHQPPEPKPDELWIVQINPQTFDGEPTSVEEIADRRNELSGNISLNQELRFVEQVNEWIDDGRLSTAEFSQTTVHRIDMGKRFHCATKRVSVRSLRARRRIDMGKRFHCVTKLDRDPAFIAKLMDLGRERCGDFLDDRQ